MSGPVKAVRVERLPIAPGEFKLTTHPKRGPGISGLIFACPCGCGDVGGANFNADGWTWDGNEDAPTVTPSLQRVGGCGWHGFLRNGEFVDA